MSETGDFKRLDLVQERLNSVSPCFCIAKWSQVTIHLQTGTTHSCHHPGWHPIPIEELRENPSALHNTSYKIAQRKKMLAGERPAECSYCWQIEDADSENISDRIYKSAHTWSMPFLDDILKNPLSERTVPRYVEVDLGNVCNFRCSYCLPKVSSSWLAEVKKHGPYPTRNLLHGDCLDFSPLPDDQNPYLEAWWKWWPELYPQLVEFRVTGGEPLLNPGLYRMLEWMEKHPHPDLAFSINTNMGVAEKQWEKFLHQVGRIEKEGKVKGLTLHSSCEAWGERAEYIRNGLKYDLWLTRLRHILTHFPKIKVSLMITYNALSLTSFERFLEDIYLIKTDRSFANKERPVPLFVDISYLRFPEHQSIKILPLSYKAHILSQVEFMKKHAWGKDSRGIHQEGFFPFEIQKMERLLSWFDAEEDQGLKDQRRADFYLFFAEHDRRRGTDFLRTFPEMRDFWNLCKHSAEQQLPEPSGPVP